jgi:hypothetical protein
MLFSGLGGVLKPPRNAVSKRFCASFLLYWSLSMANVLIEFNDFPQHRELVGRLLIAYGELEFIVVHCLGEALNITPSAAVRILFRVRGEAARIGVADAIARPAFIKVGLGDQWGTAIGAAKKCLKYRNLYAHCHWRLIDGVLRFMDLDEEAIESPATDEHLGLLELRAASVANSRRGAMSRKILFTRIEMRSSSRRNSPFQSHSTG